VYLKGRTRFGGSLFIAERSEKVVVVVELVVVLATVTGGEVTAEYALVGHKGVEKLLQF
jgi:hypothetical protein